MKAALVLALAAATAEACTMMLAGKKATVDGSTMTTQTNDCWDCDFRIGMVPRTKHKKGEKAGIWNVRFAYPRYVGDDRAEMYKSEYLDTEIYDWQPTQPMGYIDQVEETYSYVDGSYPMINEKQLGFGESTCGSYFVSRPVGAGGQALFDVSALVRAAVERTSNARDAIALMGHLAETYGYYGAEYEPDADGGFTDARGEAGEALGVIDTEEAWMFHIAPDNTGASAVWVAQKLEDDEFAVVANQFIIRQVDLSNTDKFMGSANMESAAREGGLTVHGSLEAGTFDWTLTYATSRGHMSPYATRRVWRIFDLVAPGLNLPAETDVFAQDYPFSVVPEYKLSAADLMRFMRDHYEGTPYDMTRGLNSGPYGDPSRFDPSANNDGVSDAMSSAGRFERAISLYRASYSFVVVCRASLPDEVGGMVWVGYYAPHASVYVPFYPLASSPPDSFSHGSLFKLDRSTTYWAHAAAGNYADRFYRHTIKEFVSLQNELEPAFMKQQAEVEAQVADVLQRAAAGELGVVPEGQTVAGWVADYLADFTNACAKTTHKKMWALLDHLFEKYHDGMELLPSQSHADKYAPSKLFYPLEWLQAVGFFPAGSPYNTAAPAPATTTLAEARAVQGGHAGGMMTGFLGVVVGVCAGAVMGMSYQRSKHSYQAI